MRTLPALLLFVAAAAADPPRVTGREPVLGRCDGCEGVFQGIPATLASSGRIAPSGEPGEPMVLRGHVSKPDGSPAAGIVIYAYHTDNQGIYPRLPSLTGAAARHGRLRGWAQTDSKGDYLFDTIRPKAYPNQNIAAHVHMHVIEPGLRTYYIDELLFADDPLLTAETRRRQTEGRGGDGVTQPVRDTNGVWQTRRDIILGRGIPDYR